MKTTRLPSPLPSHIDCSNTACLLPSPFVDLHVSLPQGRSHRPRGPRACGSACANQGPRRPRNMACLVRRTGQELSRLMRRRLRNVQPASLLPPVSPTQGLPSVRRPSRLPKTALHTLLPGFSCKRHPLLSANQSPLPQQPLLAIPQGQSAASPRLCLLLRPARAHPPASTPTKPASTHEKTRSRSRAKDKHDQPAIARTSASAPGRTPARSSPTSPPAGRDRLHWLDPLPAPAPCDTPQGKSPSPASPPPPQEHCRAWISPQPPPEAQTRWSCSG